MAFNVFGNGDDEKHFLSKALSFVDNLRLNCGMLILNEGWVRRASPNDEHPRALRRAVQVLKAARVRRMNVDLTVCLRWSLEFG